MRYQCNICTDCALCSTLLRCNFPYWPTMQPAWQVLCPRESRLLLLSQAPYLMHSWAKFVHQSPRCSLSLLTIKMWVIIYCDYPIVFDQRVFLYLSLTFADLCLMPIVLYYAICLLCVDSHATHLIRSKNPSLKRAEMSCRRPMRRCRRHSLALNSPCNRSA